MTTDFMDEQAVVVVGNEGDQPISVSLCTKGGQFSAAYFASGKMWPLERRLLELLLIEGKPVRLLMDSEQGAQWFRKTIERLDREQCAEKWEKDHGYDKYGVGEWLRSNVHSAS